MPATVEPSRAEAYHRITEVLHCKWTIAVIDAIERGTVRPSHIRKLLPGLSAKVLNERLRKLERYGLVERRLFAEVPPRAEYRFTARGRSLLRLVRTIRTFVDDWSSNGGIRP